MSTWSEHDVPDLHGRVAVVTGANSGIGLRVATVLAQHGAEVLLACRSAERGRRAAASIPGSRLVLVDLGELDSVRAAAESIRDICGDRLDLLVNNAGIPAAAVPRNAAGHESVLAVNHLGHAALTWRLMPALTAGTRPRVVTVASNATRLPGFDVDDLNFEHRRYSWTRAYPQSKFANLVFARELARRLAAAGSPVVSVAAHPGYAATNLARSGARSQGLGRGLAAVVHVVSKGLSQSARSGALPILCAATDPAARNGDYLAPRLFRETYHGVGPARVPPAADDPATGRRLWTRTAELTGVAPQP